MFAVARANRLDHRGAAEWMRLLWNMMEPKCDTRLRSPLFVDSGTWGAHPNGVWRWRREGS